jgi:lipid A ethanolaminephosphotransferase
LDDVMLKGLDARIAALPAERRAKGVVLVMHQMGSHGPAYYKRSAPDVKRFTPECKTNALAECGHNELMNVYDNSIARPTAFSPTPSTGSRRSRSSTTRRCST